MNKLAIRKKGEVMNHVPLYQFRKNKYGDELLIDLIRLEDLDKYIRKTPCHKLNYHDITLITNGNGYFKINCSEFPIEPNQLYFTAPHQIREWKTTQIPGGMVLIFEEEFICNFFRDSQFVRRLSYFQSLHNPPQLKLDAIQGDYLISIFKQIENEIQQKRDNHILRALLYQVLAWLNTIYQNNYNVESVSSNNKVIQFKELVENYYIQEHSVSFYASKLCITSGYLNELVKIELSVTAKQYLINRLIIEAKRLLVYHEYPIAEIAWKLGFSEPSYFIRVFRKESGTSPLSYRNQHS